MVPVELKHRGWLLGQEDVEDVYKDIINILNSITHMVSKAYSKLSLSQESGKTLQKSNTVLQLKHQETFSNIIKNSTSSRDVSMKETGKQF